MSVFSVGASNGLYVKDLDDVFGIGATINSSGVFQAATGPEIRRVTGNPNGTVSDFGGSLALDVTNGQLYINTSTGNVAGTTWAVANQASVVPFVQIVSGTPVTNTAAETVLASYTIPANTLKAGTRLTVQWMNRVTADAGATTLTTRLRLGPTTLTGTLLANTAAIDTGAAWGSTGNYTVVSRAAPSAASACVGTGFITQFANLNAGAATGAGTGSALIVPTNFATNGPLLLELTAQWGAVDANSVQCEIFNVTVM